jgi:hypothetical protein
MPVQPPAGIPVAAQLSAAQSLEALARELTTRGWVTRPHAPAGRRPSLYVQNPEPGASLLSEHIYASPSQDGTWWYWWPWAAKIAPVADPGTAAATVTRVLPAVTDAEATP